MCDVNLTERELRERKLIRALGDGVWCDRDPVLNAVARYHIGRAEPFDLVACLADMVRHQITAKNSAMEVASKRGRYGF